MIKNKRGDIPITIFVLGVVAICILAILSFYFSYSSVRNSFNSIDLVEEAVLAKEKIAVYQSLGLSKEEAEKFFDIKTDQLGKHLYFERDSVSVRQPIP